MLDITGRIGPLYTPKEPPEWPMYSFDCPAALLWNAIANEFFEAGWNKDQIKEWLQSKNARWALDGALGESVNKIGKDYARKIINEEKRGKK